MNPNQITEVPAVSVTLTARDRKGPLPEADLSTVVVSHALRGEGHDASEDGTGRGTPIIAFNARQDPDNWAGDTGPIDTDGGTQAIAFSSKDHGGDATVEVSPTVRAGTHDGSHANAGVPPAVAYDVTAFDSKDMALGSDGATSTLTTNGSQPGKAGGRLAFASSWAVRRLTPTECARLQGFPDDYLSQVKHRGKPPADGPMYKALGNSMAVNCMRILGERIQMVEDRYGKD
jgi:DNA (cytosine-5)-methyltransferase 1